jgi:ubiquinone biosynthesis protein
MLRLVDIVQVSLKYGLEDYVNRYVRNSILSSSLSLTKNLFGRKRINEPPEVRLRLALQELGPVFIKFGQMLSHRRDLLPARFISELAKLKDQIEPSKCSNVLEILNAEFPDYKSHFEYVDTTPIAVASIAEVYSAKLKSGEDVVVKILRPNVKKLIKNDLEVFKNLLKYYNIINGNFRTETVYDILLELELSLNKETDFMLEMFNLEKFADNFKDFDGIKIPMLYKQLSNDKLIVMEKMQGTPIDNVDILKSKGIDVKKISEQGLELLVLQIFKYRFFHADQHSGNVWIDDNGNRIYLDFGIMGTLSEQDRNIALQLLTCIYTSNFKKFAEVQITAGWFKSDVDKEKLIETYKKISVNLVKGSLTESMRELLELGEVFGVKVPAQFTLLIKTLLVAEGTSHTLNPDIDLEKIGTSVFLKHFKSYL